MRKGKSSNIVILGVSGDYRGVKRPYKEDKKGQQKAARDNSFVLWLICKKKVKCQNILRLLDYLDSLFKLCLFK